MRVLDKENKVDQSKAVKSSGTKKGKKVWLKKELHKNILPDNSKEHHGTQICNTLQEYFHYTEATFKINYPAWSTSDATSDRRSYYTTITRTWEIEILLICFAHLLENK